MSLFVSYKDIERAAERIAGTAHITPVATSRTVDDRVNASVFFKCENLQRVGAFKFRGAYNAITAMSDEARSAGVLTYSSGNHAQAVALASQLAGISSTIIMPDDAPTVKREATAGYGGHVVLYDKHEITREALAEKIAKEQNLTVVPPYDHPDVIAGQGTATRELLLETGPLDILLVCCGGGGLLSGSAVVARTLAPDCKVIGVEPEAADDATRTFYSGIKQTVYNPDTIADGARTPSLGNYTMPIIMEMVDDMVTVSDSDLRRALKFVWSRMKLVIEPTGALATAALFKYSERFKGQRVGIIFSGGNVDLTDTYSFFNSDHE